MEKNELKKNIIGWTLFINFITTVTYAFCIVFPITMDIFRLTITSIIFLIVTIIMNYLMFRIYKKESRLLEKKNKLFEDKPTEVILISTDNYDYFTSKLLDSCKAKFTAIKNSEDNTEVIIYVKLMTLDGNIVYDDIFERISIYDFYCYYKFKEE